MKKKWKFGLLLGNTPMSASGWSGALLLVGQKLLLDLEKKGCKHQIVAGILTAYHIDVNGMGPYIKYSFIKVMWFIR